VRLVDVKPDQDMESPQAQELDSLVKDLVRLVFEAAGNIGGSAHGQSILMTSCSSS
jgi:hypothetical protein